MPSDTAASSSRAEDELAYCSTNCLISSLRSCGFGTHNITLSPSTSDLAAPTCNIPPTAFSTLSPPPPPSYSLAPSSSSSSTQPFAETHSLALLDAIASILDSDDSKVAAASCMGLYVREDGLLAVDIMACGTGPRVHHEGPRPGSLESLRTVKPLMLVVERGGRIPLFEHIQVINHFLESLTATTTAVAFNSTFNMLVKYVTASHAAKIVHRIKNNALSRPIIQGFCSLPKPSTLAISPTATTTVEPRAYLNPNTSASPPTFPGLLPVAASVATPPSASPMASSLSRMQIERDRLFLERLLHPHIIARLHGKVPISHLQHAARASRHLPRTAAPVPIYYCHGGGGARREEWDLDACCDEFHALLVFLVGEEGFLGSLTSFVRLVSMYEKAIMKMNDETTGCSGRSREDALRRMGKKLGKACSKLTTYGILFRDVLACSAFPMHLKRMRGRMGSLPRVKLGELGRGSENMDFGYQSAGMGGCVEEVFGMWMRMQVEHLESLFVVQRWMAGMVRGLGAGKWRVGVRTVVVLPRTRLGDAPVLEAADLPGGDDRDRPLQAWREVIRDVFAPTPVDENLIVQLMENLVGRYPLSEEMHVHFDSHGWSPYHPEACLATFISKSCQKDPEARKTIRANSPQCETADMNVTETHLIGVSRSCCSSCVALLKALCLHSSGPANHEFVTTLMRMQRSRIPAAILKESIFAGAQCSLPSWISDDVTKEVVREVRGRLSHLVVDELSLYVNEEEDDNSVEMEGFDEVEDPEG